MSAKEDSEIPNVGIDFLAHAPGGLEAMTPGAAGFDLRAAVTNDTLVEPGRLACVPTGIRLAIPAGFEAQVRPRSGLALRSSIGVLNSPGTIDSDYRGEIQILLYNFGSEPFRIVRGDRIAQMVFARVFRPRLELRPLEETGRGTGGFGSTGRG